MIRLKVTDYAHSPARVKECIVNPAQVVYVSFNKDGALLYLTSIDGALTVRDPASIAALQALAPAPQAPDPSESIALRRECDLSDDY